MTAQLFLHLLQTVQEQLFHPTHTKTILNATYHLFGVRFPALKGFGRYTNVGLAKIYVHRVQ